jgi:hypothetical protein
MYSSKNVSATICLLVTFLKITFSYCFTCFLRPNSKKISLVFLMRCWYNRALRHHANCACTCTVDVYSTTCVLQATYKYGNGDILPPPFFHPLASSIGGISPHAVPTHLSKLPHKRGLKNVKFKKI